MRLACLMLGPCFASSPGHAPTRRAASQSGKNALIKHFAPAAQSERSKARFMFLAEAVHKGLKNSRQQWDVWLQDKTMRCLADWRSTLEDPAWALAGEIASQLNGARKVATNRLTPWMLASKGYRTSVCNWRWIKTNCE